jgi:Flp pilus assembly protein TadG
VRNLLRCRRGSVAFATVIALVPLIGVVALGAEAGSWYVTKQNAQNAADAAAYSGGLTLACSISGSTKCDTAQTYVDRGKQFAAQNGFCNAGDSLSGCALPTGTSRTVQIDQPTANRVRAVVSQQQPAYLAAVLGLSTVNIGAQAIVEVQNPKDLCALGLGPDNNGLTIGGSSNITGNGCGLMSDTAVKYNSTPTFSGSGWAVNGVNGCVASAGHCALSVPYNYNMLPATNPLAILDGTNQSFNSWTSTGSPNDLACSGTLTPNNSTNLYRK